MTKLDGLYEVLAPGSVAQKTDNFTSINRERGNLDVTVRISDIAKFGTRNERKTKLHKHINRRGPRNLEKFTEAKVQSQKKEFTKIQKGDRKMKHRKRDNASGVLSNGSNIDRAMRVRMPKVRANLAPPETNTENVTNVSPQVASSNTLTDLVPQNTDYQPLIAAPPTSTTSELQLPSTSAPLEPFQQFVLKTSKRTRKCPKYCGIDNDDSSGESTNSCPPNLMQPRKTRRVADIEPVQPSVEQTIATTAAQVERIFNP